MEIEASQANIDHIIRRHPLSQCQIKVVDSVKSDQVDKILIYPLRKRKRINKHSESVDRQFE